MTPRLRLSRRWVAGDTIELAPAESRHVKVLRLQPGDAVVVFSGDEDAEWPAEIVAIDRAGVRLRIGAAPRRVELELAPAVTVAVGIPANERMDALVEKACELGAAALQPLVCTRSVVRLAGERAETRQRHWQAVAVSASEQCGRARVMRVAVPTRFDAWLRSLGPAGAERRWVLSLAASARPARELQRTGDDPAALGLIVVSGPEGGLAPEEESAALACGFVPVSLGPRTLRADTAPLALLAWLGLAGAEGRE